MAEVAKKARRGNHVFQDCGLLLPVQHHQASAILWPLRCRPPCPQVTAASLGHLTVSYSTVECSVLFVFLFAFLCFLRELSFALESSILGTSQDSEMLRLSDPSPYCRTFNLPVLELHTVSESAGLLQISDECFEPSHRVGHITAEGQRLGLTSFLYRLISSCHVFLQNFKLFSGLACISSYTQLWSQRKYANNLLSGVQCKVQSTFLRHFMVQ